jgi:hypothetical protein
MPEPCYRALVYLPHQSNRWNAGVFNSFHPATHPHWDGIWAEKEHAHPAAEHAAGDFPLDFAAGRYSEQARANYLHLKRAKGGENWTNAEICSATELAGVCAFNGESGPLRAYQYAASSGLSEDEALIVTFMGEVVCGLPEAGGVLARVIEPVGEPMTAAAFRAHHGLPQYVAIPPAEALAPEEADLYAGYELETGPQIDPQRDNTPAIGPDQEN